MFSESCRVQMKTPSQIQGTLSRFQPRFYLGHELVLDRSDQFDFVLGAYNMLLTGLTDLSFDDHLFALLLCLVTQLVVVLHTLQEVLTCGRTMVHNKQT